MKIYLCKWPDDTGKIIACKNRQELFWALDYESDPYCAKFKELKCELSINFKFEIVDQYRCTLFTGYDEYNGDFIREAFDCKKGWKTFGSYLPYANGSTKDSGSDTACTIMGWNPSNQSSKEKHN